MINITENLPFNGWVLDFEIGGSHYVHDMNVISQTNGDFEGNGGYPSGAASYSHPWTMTGKVDGNNVDLVIVYVSPAPNPGYTVRANGDIASDGTLSGDWSSSIGQNGTWSSTFGSVSLNCDGKGEFHYSDILGRWYDVDVQYVNVVGNKAYFAGPVIAASNPGWIDNWLSAAVMDGGEPAYMVDSIWGIFAANMATAKYNVVSKITPDEKFDITSGNLQVHSYPPLD